jgi:hypothetical protein
LRRWFSATDSIPPVPQAGSKKVRSVSTSWSAAKPKPEKPKGIPSGQRIEDVNWDEVLPFVGYQLSLDLWAYK